MKTNIMKYWLALPKHWREILEIRASLYHWGEKRNQIKILLTAKSKVLRNLHAHRKFLKKEKCELAVVDRLIEFLGGKITPWKKRKIRECEKHHEYARLPKIK